MHTCATYTCTLSRRVDGFVVDIDRASFGHEVVEIETMSSLEEADIVSARDSITALARSLGVQQNGKSGRPVKVRSIGCASARVLFSLTLINVQNQYY